MMGLPKWGKTNLVILATLLSKNRNVHTYRPFNILNVGAKKWISSENMTMYLLLSVKELKHCQFTDW